MGQRGPTRIGTIRKSPTGIHGFDEITNGGLPTGRPCLVVGGPGTGKTLLGVEFLVNGATKYGEPGVILSFEESEKEIIQNSASLGFDLKNLIDKKKLVLDCITLEPERIIETGEYDLEGLFVMLNDAIDSIGAKRVLLDTLEAIFGTYSQQNIIRAEMARLFRFLKQKGVTSVITAESGANALSRHGLEEYITDMVMALDHRVIDDIATRRLRIVKYRGSAHGTNEYPFIIESNGISVLPVTSIGLTATASRRRIATGIADLDAMLGGQGYYEGSTILVTGAAGTGKTSLAAQFARKASLSGRKVLYCMFEESPSQITRNMKSIGVDLAPLIKSGKLTLYSDRPSSAGLEMHLAKIHHIVEKVKPNVVVLDPISSLWMLGSGLEIRSMLLRATDYFKMQGTTVLMTELASRDQAKESPMISSLADTWIMLEEETSSGEKNRLISVIKSRGMAHSNQMREMIITDDGIRLIPTHISDSGVLTGTSRYVQEMKDQSESATREEEIVRLKKEMKILNQKLQLQTQTLKIEMAEKESALRRRLADADRMRNHANRTHERIARLRGSSGGSEGE